jgi:hypothetical protein
MGFFSKVLGGGKELPRLESSHPAAARVGQVQASLEKLAGDIPDRLEVVPAEKAVYVFAGKPPTKFGMFWVEGEELHNFKTLSRDKGLSSLDLQPVVEKLRKAYKEHAGEEHYSLEVGGRTVVVTPSQALGDKVEQIIQGVAG